MNLRDLEYTVCLAPEGQLRRAAERCHVSQPTMSAQIAKLRTSSGFNYFKRGMRAATPTVNGRAVIRQAQIVLGVDGIGARRPGPVSGTVPPEEGARSQLFRRNHTD